MRQLPRTLFGQILLALLAGLLVVQVLGAWFMFDERARLAERLLGLHAARRIAGIISVLDRASSAERRRLVHALDVPPTRITLDEPWRAAPAPASPEALAFTREVARALGHSYSLQVLAIEMPPFRRPALALQWPPRQLFIGTSTASGAKPGPDFRDGRLSRVPPWRRPWRHGRLIRLVVAQARLTDGTVVTFRQALLAPPADEPLRILGWLALMGVTSALLAGWAVRRLIRPLGALSRAAAGLARNLDQPPMPESGPTEISSAARAFNAMQRDFKRVLETRAQALAAISHDLRLPLTRLRLRLERVSDARLKADIERDINEMDGMIGNTLAFLRAGATGEKPIRFDLNAMIEDLCEDMEALGAHVRRQGAAQTPLVGRPQALRRCFGNLLENARRYGGRQIDVITRELGGAIEVCIEDRGPGVPDAERERIFEPYVRLDASRGRNTGGSGLGLPIARAIARFHGGDVRLGSRDGGGLSVVVMLPRRSEDSAEPPRTG